MAWLREREMGGRERERERWRESGGQPGAGWCMLHACRRRRERQREREKEERRRNHSHNCNVHVSNRTNATKSMSSCCLAARAIHMQKAMMQDELETWNLQFCSLLREDRRTNETVIFACEWHVVAMDQGLCGTAYQAQPDCAGVTASAL